MSKSWYGILLVLLSLGAGCSRQASSSKAKAMDKTADPPAIQYAVAETRQVEKAISVTGSLLPDEMVSASAEVAGRVASIRVDFGQRVRKGEAVAELDKQEFLLQVERSRAALAQAMARIGLDPSQENISPESTPAIREATAQLENARFKYESAAKLVETGDVSQERYIELEKAYRARQAALDATRNDLLTQLASVRALRAEVKLAQKRLNDATVRSPFDGAVSEKLVSPGQYLKENTPILTLVKTYPLRLRVEVPESAADVVNIGTSLTFTTDAASTGQFHALVRELNPALDAKSRSLTVEARLVENDPRLRAGMFVQVRLVTDRNVTIVVVPKEAIFAVAGLTKMFVLKDDRAVEARVPPGQEIDGWVEVPAEAVRPGDKVAVSNLAALVDGTRVKAEVKPGRQG